MKHCSQEMKTFKLPLKDPSPDFETFVKVLMGKVEPQRVHFVEVLVDQEIIKFVVKEIIGRKWVSPNEDKKAYLREYIEFFYRMGYDYVPLFRGVESGGKWWGLQEGWNIREAKDTAIFSRGKRVWADEGRGVIHSWQDFEQFPWEKITLDLEPYEFVDKNLPEGMKMTFFTDVFETVLEWILGYEGLCYLLYDQPDLVKAVFDKWGEKAYTWYKSLVSLDNFGALFHADDLGYKTGTIISPDSLRELYFPWFRKYASLAHDNGKMCWCHSCGNVLEVMEDLIEDVQIDAYHSFQDIIIPVGEFKKRYGGRIAILGGVDMDKLCRWEEKSLREYVRDILNECMSGGRYALGSGNSIANYVPVRNYFAMLEEGLRWK